MSKKQHSQARERAMKKFKEAHPDYWKRKNAEFYAANREQQKQRRKDYYADHPDQEMASSRKYYRENKEELLLKQKTNTKRKEYFKKYYAELKKRIISAYGGKCACCGETHFEFLTIDHVNGGGRRDRGKHSGAGFYSYLEKKGFPQEGYRLLCINCNFAFGIYGHCPHQS